MWLQWDWGEGPRLGGRRTSLWCAWLAWSRFRVVIPVFDKTLPTDTNPGAIYAGYTDKNDQQVSWGYLDDECDGIVSVELTVGGKALRAFARIGAGPPSFAPDGLPIRTVSDELEQAMFGPIMAPTLVDNLSVVALHQTLLTALKSGTPAWFADVLRKPDEIGDLSDKGRRKMPAMMRGADARYLTLTRRQIDMIRKSVARGLFS